MKENRLPPPGSIVRHFATKAEEFSGVNESGIAPVGTKVLVLTDWIDDVTTGGIHLTPDKQIEITLAITTGVLVDVGGGAFTDWPNSDRRWPGKVPAIGDRVHIAKYCGIIIDGKDGRRYRLLHDTDVAGFETSHKAQVFGIAGAATTDVRGGNVFGKGQN